MSRARHEKMKADGGTVKPYNAQGSNVEAEAEEKASGGRAKKKAGGMVDGDMKKKRLDRPGRKAGGRVGADKNPLTGAANVRNASDHNADVSGNASDND